MYRRGSAALIALMDKLLNIRHLLVSILILVAVVAVQAQQMADPEFKSSVEKPSYSRGGPRVMFDEAHNNFHTMDGRYKPFVTLFLTMAIE